MCPPVSIQSIINSEVVVVSSGYNKKDLLCDSVKKTELLALYIHWLTDFRALPQMSQPSGKSLKNGKSNTLRLTYLFYLRQSLKVCTYDSMAIMLNRYMWAYHITHVTVIQTDPARRCRWSLRRRSGKFCSVQTRKTTSTSVLNTESQTSVGCWRNLQKWRKRERRR